MTMLSKTKLSVGMLSLGCPKTLVDSELVLGRLNPAHYQIAQRISECDIAFVNTCTFIDSSKKESIEHILDLIDLKKTGQIKALIILGCLVQRYANDVVNEFKEVDAFLGTGEYDKIPEIVDQISKKIEPVGQESKLTTYEPFTAVGKPGFLYGADHGRVALTPTHYRYVKISEGCDHNCSFCTIPSFRGRHRSRPIQDIVREVTLLAEQGCKEIVLTGQDTTHYGKDFSHQFLLPELLKELSRVDKIEWIRLLYAYPLFVNEKLICAIADTPKVCHYLDIPLQHISDSILKSMKRGVSKEHTVKLIRKLRSEIPDLAIRTTFIVGYPGETDKDFSELLEFIEESKFERLGVFTYSREEGTPAGDLKNQISKSVKQKRFKQAMSLQQTISREFAARWIGKELKVIVDETAENDPELYIGRSFMDAPEIDGNVIFKSPNHPLRLGDFARVKISHSDAYDLIGEVA